MGSPRWRLTMLICTMLFVTTPVSGSYRVREAGTKECNGLYKPVDTGTTIAEGWITVSQKREAKWLIEQWETRLDGTFWYKGPNGHFIHMSAKDGYNMWYLRDPTGEELYYVVNSYAR